jgi:hypothetical protein
MSRCHPSLPPMAAYERRLHRPRSQFARALQRLPLMAASCCHPNSCRVSRSATTTCLRFHPSPVPLIAASMTKNTRID